jgi:hypothetical protein
MLWAPQMQAIGMHVDMVTGRYVELHCFFFAFEELALDVGHFVPSRAPIRATDTDMVPTIGSAGDNHQFFAIIGAWQLEYTAGCIATPTAEAYSCLDVTVAVQLV